jgi:hypothetical protein
MTSSARSRTVCGILNPSALAVSRLITSSNLVGCWIGRSAGADQTPRWSKGDSNPQSRREKSDRFGGAPRPDFRFHQHGTDSIPRGTEGSNPASSSGESGANSISWIMVAADARMRVSGVPTAGRSCSTSWCSSQGQRGDDRNRVDVGRFLPEIPRPPETPRHCHDIRCRGADHVDLAVAKRQFGVTAGLRDDATAHLVPD